MDKPTNQYNKCLIIELGLSKTQRFINSIYRANLKEDVLFISETWFYYIIE